MIARLIISKSQRQIAERVEEILSRSGLKNPHPDLLYFPADSKLGIAEAKKIKEHFSTKAYSAKAKAVILEDGSKLTGEAQNSLLKIFEEPPAQSIIILAAASEANFLPTLLSRCEIVYLPEIPSANPHQGDNFEKIKKLLQSSVEERFEYIEKSKEREELLRTLVTYFHHHLASNTGSANLTKKLLQAEEWAKQNVNIRAILEYLMLVIPSD